MITLLITTSYAQELDDLIKSQDLLVNQNLEKLQDFINLTEQNKSKYQLHAKAIINDINHNNGKNLKLNCLRDLASKEQYTTSTNLALYIFASLSMPKLRLIELIKSATHYNGVVVFKGLKNNSYQETAKYLQPIIKAAGAGVIIDPTLFSEFNIIKVPVFVLHNPIIKQHDQITGNISLTHALEEFAKHGDLKQAASNLLKVQP